MVRSVARDVAKVDDVSKTDAHVFTRDDFSGFAMSSVSSQEKSTRVSKPKDYNVLFHFM